MQEEKYFQCWACEKRVYTKHEIAQSVCDKCRASIIQKLYAPYNINNE